MHMSQTVPYKEGTQFCSFDFENGQEKNIEIGCYHMKMYCYDIVILFELQNDEQKYKELVSPLLHSNTNFLIINVLFFDVTDYQSFIQIEKYFEILKSNHVVESSTPLANLIVAKNSHLTSQKKVSIGDALVTAQKHYALFIETGANDESDKVIEAAIALKAIQFGEKYLFSPFDSWRIALSEAQREASIPPNLTKIEQEWRESIDELLSSLENLIRYTNMNPYIAHKELAIDLFSITKKFESSSKQLEMINFSLKLIGNEKNFYETEENKVRKEVLTILKINEEYENKVLKEELKMKVELLKEKSKTHQPKEIGEICENFAADLYHCEQMFLNDELGSQNENKDSHILRKIGFKEKEFKEKILTQLALYKNSANHMQAAIYELKNFEDKINESIKNADECLNAYNVLNILNIQPILNFVDFFIANKRDECHVDQEECGQKCTKVGNSKEYAYFLTQSEETIKRNRFECLDIVEELKKEFREKDNKLMEIEILKHNLSIVKRNEDVHSQTFKEFMANSKMLTESKIESVRQPRKSIVEEFFDSAALKIGYLTNFKFDSEPIIEGENEANQKKIEKIEEQNNEMRNELAEKIDGIASSIEQTAKIQYEKVVEKTSEVFSNTSKVVNENLDNLATHIDETANKIERFANKQIKAGEEKVSEIKSKIEENILHESSVQNITPNIASIKNSFSNKIEGIGERVEEVTRGRPRIFGTETKTTSNPVSAYFTNDTSVVENFLPNIDEKSFEKKVLNMTEDIQEGAIRIQESLNDKMKGVVDTAQEIVTYQYENGIEKIDDAKTSLNGKISNDFHYKRVTDKIEGFTSNISKEAVTEYERITSKLDKEKDQIESSLSHATKTLSEKRNNLGSLVSNQNNEFEEKVVYSMDEQISNISKATKNISDQIQKQIEQSSSKIESTVKHASNSVAHYDHNNHQVDHHNDHNDNHYAGHEEND